MKEIAREGQARIRKKTSLTFVAAWHVIMLIGGFMFSRVSVLNTCAPFGIALVCAAPKTFVGASMVGACVGYFIPVTGANAYSYIAAVIAIAIIRSAMPAGFRFSRTPEFSAFTGAVAVLLPGLITCFLTSAEPKNFLTVFIESAICAGSSYFIFRTMKILVSGKGFMGMADPDLISAIAVIGIILMSLTPIKALSVSAAGIIAVTVTLCAAYYGRYSAGAIAGASLGFFIALSSGDVNRIAVLTVSGIAAGLFSSVGIVGSAASFLIADTTLSMIVTGGLAFSSLYESMAGSLIFVLMPRNAKKGISAVFSPKPEMPRLDGLRKNVSMRLRCASEAISKVNSTVDKVSQRLKEINERSFEDVILDAKKKYCSGCCFNDICWQEEKDSNMSAFARVYSGGLTRDKLPQPLVERCPRTDRICKCVNENYNCYKNRRDAQDRVDEMRGILLDQFDGIAGMMNEMAVDFEKSQKYDYIAAEKAQAALIAIGVIPIDISCAIDKYDRMTVEIRVRSNVDRLNKKQIMCALSAACDRDFDVPCISGSGNSALVLLSERPSIAVDAAYSRINCGSNRMCGDSVDSFYDGKGRFVTVLSDGMGTGGRAAVDGAMTSGLMAQLIKAGFGFDSSLRIVNSAMMYKSTDESLATLDLTSIDLYSGRIEMYKAGACPTIIRRSGKCGKASCSSLPIGILDDIGFDTAALNLSIGDIIVMTSDGAATDGSDWMCEVLENADSTTTAQELADRIVYLAKHRRDDGHDDDITAVVAILKKAI